MASIRRRNGKWQVQVRRTNQPSVSKSFIQKSDAERWARVTESKLDVEGLLPDTGLLKRLTLRNLITRYLDQITPHKRSHESERLRLKKIGRHELASTQLVNLKPANVSSYIDDRTEEVEPGTIAREIGTLHHVIETAKLRWNIPVRDNPFKQISKPKEPPSRNRRLEPDCATRSMDFRLSADQSSWHFQLM
ncbi:MAG: hypothetical protein QF521_13940 [Alphaproteobacteria bacterium]|nr:hypothetical protein [Alphaproteobacteria bacterium]